MAYLRANLGGLPLGELLYDVDGALGREVLVEGVVGHGPLPEITQKSVAQ